MWLNKNTRSLTNQIKWTIGSRVFLCFLLASVIVLFITANDIETTAHQLETNLTTQCKSLEGFVISQTLIQDQGAIQARLDYLSQQSGGMKFIWTNQQSPVKKESLFWKLPFNWIYYYPIRNIDGSMLGTFLITGSFFNNSTLSSNLFANIGLLLIFFIIIFVVLYPLAHSIPERLFIRPINDLLFLLRNGKNNTDSAESSTIPNEISEIKDKISVLLKDAKEQSRQAALGQIATQVAHDIRSPVAAIQMLAKEGINLPEEQRITLREAADRIQDIANDLLNQSRSALLQSDASNTISNFLISAAILSVIAEKKMQYKNIGVVINHDFTSDATFAYIHANLVEFKRVISNLLNNAIEAIEGTGKILVELTNIEHAVKVCIIDSGKGMSPEMIEKVLKEKAVTTKSSGFGLGFSHTKTFLASTDAQLNITSQIGAGTAINLLFKQAPCPSWLANEIVLYKDSIVIILDDDSSIHGAWDSLFAPIIRNNSSIDILHFISAEECISYLNSLSIEVLSKVVLLTDYELIKQDLNGLDVIEKTNIAKAILVTSHHENKSILKKAALLNTKILPKMLASSVTVKLAESIEKPKTQANIVIVEDNKALSDVVSYICELHGKSVDLYSNSYDLLNNIDGYDRTETKICLDYDLGSCINGIELSHILWKKGFGQLYLATGYELSAEEIPTYLNVLPAKMDLLKL